MTNQSSVALALLYLSLAFPWAQFFNPNLYLLPFTSIVHPQVPNSTTFHWPALTIT